MELYQQIILNGLEQGALQITLSDQAQQWVEGMCYQALKKIKAVIDDDSFDDDACFLRIEEILFVLEEIGSDGGMRHDFG